MGYQLNSDAYIIFTKIEIGVREFLIELIKKKGIHEWTKNFLGKVHLDSLKMIGNRIYEAIKNELIPDPTDIYLSKIRKENNLVKKKKPISLLHPFYYLGWSDLIGLINKNENFEIIGSSVGTTSRDILINNLNILIFIRNDIAHSRFISDSDLQFVNIAYEQISLAIPDFNKLHDCQTSEKNLSVLFEGLKANIDEIGSSGILELNKIEDFQKLLDECLNSFWLNSIIVGAIPPIQKLAQQIQLYKIYRGEPGGLLKIQGWKKENKILLKEIKNLIDE